MVLPLQGSAEYVGLRLLEVSELRIEYINKLINKIHFFSMIDAARIAQRTARFIAGILVDQDAAEHERRGVDTGLDALRDGAQRGPDALLNLIRERRAGELVSGLDEHLQRLAV